MRVMLLGKIFGKVTTTEFKFLVEHETKKFEYVQVYHGAYEYVLCQILEIEKQDKMTTALCQVIGFKDKKDNKIKKLRIPFEPGSEVFKAENAFISEIIQLENLKNGAYIGKLDGKNIPVHLDLKKLLTKHVAILAKSGSGKSYTVGVLLEEIIDKKVPLLIIDPHGEYATMKRPNANLEEIEQMSYFNIKPEGFKINEYGDTTINPHLRPLRLPNNLTAQELINLLPIKLSASQLGVLYSATQHAGECDFDTVIHALQQEESNAKWSIISAIEQLRDINLFSSAPTPYHELVKTGSCSIINFRGIPPEIQEIIVYKLTKDLFELRKQNKIPPFFLVVEECHNYCPERSYGEKKSSKIIRNIASEGRKFGLGLAVISQRPARVDKSVISQCSTQIIMKVTNPNDLKAISSSVEGITSNTEREIQDISIGTALITGITEVPLFVRVRPRKSHHGGHAIDILNGNSEQINDETKDLLSEVQNFEDEDINPIIKPNVTPKDLMIMAEKKVKRIDTVLEPMFLLQCQSKDEQFKLLVSRKTKEVLVDKETGVTKKIPTLDTLTKKELRIVQAGYQLKQFSPLDVMHKLGSNLDINDEIEALVQKQMITKINKNTYALADRFIFNSLTNYKIFDEIQYEQIQYQEKQTPVFDIDTITKSLEKFVSIIDYAECYLLKYNVFYE